RNPPIRIANSNKTPSLSIKSPTISTPIAATALMANLQCSKQPLANMFTGIVEEAGRVERIQPTTKAIELIVRTKTCARGLKVGDSLAINGCCLTVIKLSSHANGKLAQFDLLKETWRRTNLQFAKPGSLVNLQRP